MTLAQGFTGPDDDAAVLDVDLLRFERGDSAARAAVVDGVKRSLATGFVTTSHDLSSALLDDAYGLLEQFFRLPETRKQAFVADGACGQTGYTGHLVETAAGASLADWKEMLNWAEPLPAGHPLRRRFPVLYPQQLLPEEAVPGISAVLGAFHRAIADLQRRFLRVIAVGLGVHEALFDAMVEEAPTLTRAVHYPPIHQAPAEGHVWAAAHADINLITALPRATAPGLEVLVGERWVQATPPDGHVILNSGLMLERLSNGLIPSGWHRVVAEPGETGGRLSVVQFCHPRPSTVLQPFPSCCSAHHPQRFAAELAADALEAVLHRINLTGSAC
ncbi:iron/Ascorbate oxidoreductase [Cyanobium sp. PCC 7001]|uniref:isopenicillin N synthase family dioxygenase n=1 Tax=Cyanobium sp. PCC 7001 TaxID=180281 RepID=UPI00018052A0|nr:2-oxoglutarate and iron-dependent oxygenase domain-containing protein [Cyanobium sp. PCC 7001]EDY37711.1 iron/Ascorbate oxidoreductase [Cyanobium sp. PCC 7001]